MTTFSFDDVDTEDPEFDPDFLAPAEPVNSAEETLKYDRPDSTVGAKRKRSTKAMHYEKKIGNLFNGAFRLLVSHPATVGDGAAIMMHGPEIAEKAGDLAAQNTQFARAIDMLTEGSENPYLNLLTAAAPLAIQMIRNHENAKPADVFREIRIPFIKKTFKLRFKFRLPKMPSPVRNLSHDPDTLTRHVFTDEAVAAMIKREGINVAWRANR